MGSKGSGITGSSLTILGDNPYCVHVEPVPESLVRLNAEEFFISLPHQTLIQFIHIPVGVGVTHKHDVDSLADRGFLKSYNCSVQGVISRRVRFLVLKRAEDILQEWNKAVESDVSEPAAGRIADIRSATENDITLVVNHRGERCSKSSKRAFL